jgi:hypothetical protein
MIADGVVVVRECAGVGIQQRYSSNLQSVLPKSCQAILMLTGCCGSPMRLLKLYCGRTYAPSLVCGASSLTMVSQIRFQDVRAPATEETSPLLNVSVNCARRTPHNQNNKQQGLFATTITSHVTCRSGLGKLEHEKDNHEASPHEFCRGCL